MIKSFDEGWSKRTQTAWKYDTSHYVRISVGQPSCNMNSCAFPRLCHDRGGFLISLPAVSKFKRAALRTVEYLTDFRFNYGTNIQRRSEGNKLLQLSRV